MSLDSLLHSALGNNDDDLKFIFVGGKVNTSVSGVGVGVFTIDNCVVSVLCA